jgi:hypothetical protein
MVGRSLGLQFHPEVTPDIVRGWVRAHLEAGGGDVGGIDLQAMQEETERRAPSVRLATMTLFDRFLERVARLNARSVSIDGASHT